MKLSSLPKKVLNDIPGVEDQDIERIIREPERIVVRLWNGRVYQWHKPYGRPWVAGKAD